MSLKSLNTFGHFETIIENLNLHSLNIIIDNVYNNNNFLKYGSFYYFVVNISYFSCKKWGILPGIPKAHSRQFEMSHRSRLRKYDDFINFNSIFLSLPFMNYKIFFMILLGKFCVDNVNFKTKI